MKIVSDLTLYFVIGMNESVEFEPCLDQPHYLCYQNTIHFTPYCPQLYLV
jgi:hypothetical protein